MTAHVWPHPPRRIDDRIRLSALVETPSIERTLWFDVPAAYESWLTDRADPFYLVARRWMMFEGVDAVVHGPVSTSLLAKDAEFQRALLGLLSLHPDRDIPYRQVTIDATDTTEQAAAEPEAAVATFSGGLDSLSTLHQNLIRPQPGAWDIRAAVMVHGFDVALDDEPSFAAAVDRAAPAVADAGVPLLQVSTNARDFGDWLVMASSGLAAVLGLFGGAVGRGVTAGSAPYFRDGRYALGAGDALYPWLSSRSFEVVPDGLEFDRPGKLAAMREWTLGIESVRVCYEAEAGGANCCDCMKCVGTWMHCRMLGLSTAAFTRDPAPDRVATLLLDWDPNDPVWGPAYRHGLQQWVAWAERDGIDEPWLAVARGLLAGDPPQ